MGNEMNELRYLDLKNALCEKIYEGIYKDGKKIPSERQLSTDYEVSRITVRKTLELMEKENLIVREVGNGTRVTLKNYGNANPLDVVALTAPSRNPFFATICRGTGKSNVGRLSVPFVYEKYQKRGSMAG